MRLRWKNKLYSGALQFTIFISVIIALLLAGVVLLVYTHNYFLEQSKAIVENIQLSNTGTHFLKNLQYSNADTISLPVPKTSEFQSVKVNLSQWGIFEKAYVKTIHREKRFIRCSLLGTSLKSGRRPALYLQETFKPMMVVGHTKIKGMSYLPEQGIRPGNISGNSYYGTDLIYGAVQKSKTDLPQLKYDKKNLSYYLEEYEPLNSEYSIALDPHSKVINSFKEPTKGYFSSQPIVLKNIAIIGNVIIQSTTKITIENTADLKDIILCAPVIEIKDGVRGNFQAIANTTIKVGKNCALSYPSALVMLEKEELQPQTLPYNQFFHKIYIDKNTVFKGSLCYFKTAEKEENSYPVNIYIAEQNDIKGEVYCEGNLELKGNVAGTVYTKQFLANEGGIIFVNHLYNATIISEDLPEAFGGILLEGEPKSVVKWLY